MSNNKYLIYIIYYLFLFHSCNGQVSVNKSSYGYGKFNLENGDNEAFCMINRNDGIVKSKYLFWGQNGSTKEQFTNWSQNENIIAYTSAGYLSEPRKHIPDGILIVDGKLIGDVRVNEVEDALVLTTQDGKMYAYDLRKAINFKELLGHDEILDLRKNNSGDLTRFLELSKEKQFSVFQTYLYAWNGQIVGNPENYVGNKVLMAVGNNSQNTKKLVTVIFNFKKEVKLKKAIEISLRKLSENGIVNTKLLSLPIGGDNALMFNSGDAGLPLQEYNITACNYNTSSLLVFYFEKEQIANIIQPTQAIAPPINPKPTHAKDDTLADLIDSYSTNQDAIIGMRILVAGKDENDPDLKKIIPDLNKAIFDSTIIQKSLGKYLLKADGSKQVRFKGKQFTIYIADVTKSDINLNLFNGDKGPNLLTIGNTKKMLENEHMVPLMITNGGMFMPDHRPQGLYIGDEGKIQDCDMGSDASKGNFYYKPNGVFYLVGDLAYIDTTENVAKLVAKKNTDIDIATQSGPMLVINGRIHQMFTAGSKNLNIRSGVGVIDNKKHNKVAFVITNDPSNFYDFAIFFRDILQCSNALYLDGAISKMYLRDLNPTELGGNFGPIISVTKKIEK